MYLIFQDKNVQMMNMKYCYKSKVYLTALRYVCFIMQVPSTPILILKYQVHVYYSRRKYANVLPRLLNLTRKKLALKVASSTMMCSARIVYVRYDILLCLVGWYNIAPVLKKCFASRKPEYTSPWTGFELTTDRHW
jgi:hypothetical protein